MDTQDSMVVFDVGQLVAGTNEHVDCIVLTPEAARLAAFALRNAWALEGSDTQKSLDALAYSLDQAAGGEP